MLRPRSVRRQRCPSEKLRAEFDPMAKKDAEVNARFAKLESSVSGIESSIGDLKNLIISKLNS